MNPNIWLHLLVAVLFQMPKGDWNIATVYKYKLWQTKTPNQTKLNHGFQKTSLSKLSLSPSGAKFLQCSALSVQWFFVITNVCFLKMWLYLTKFVLFLLIFLVYNQRWSFQHLLNQSSQQDAVFSSKPLLLSQMHLFSEYLAHFNPK